MLYVYANVFTRISRNNSPLLPDNGRLLDNFVPRLSIKPHRRYAKLIRHMKYILDHTCYSIGLLTAAKY